MTVSTDTTRVAYTANGLVVLFAYPFLVDDAAHLRVSVDGVVKVPYTHYTLTGIGTAAGGDVQFLSGQVPPADSIVVLERWTVPFLQSTDLHEHDSLSAETQEAVYDRLTRRIQELETAMGRVARLSDFSITALPAGALPEPAVGTFLRWASATALDNGTLTSAGTLGIPGAPTAGRLAYWIGAGSLGAAAFGATPTAGQLAYWDAAGQLVALPASLLNCGRFTPDLHNPSPMNRVEFFPHNGNQILIAGVPRTIPYELFATLDDASINKVLHGTLAANTTYYAYVYLLDGAMTIDFDTVGHKIDEDHGNEVHLTDPTRSLIGILRTDASSKVLGDGQHQHTCSWFNRVHQAMYSNLTGTTGATSYTELDSTTRVSWVQFNDESPNVHAWGTCNNNTAVKKSSFGIAINADPVNANAEASCTFPAGALPYQVPFHVVNQLPAGAGEGFFEAKFMAKSESGGTAQIINGVMATSPLAS